MKYNLIVLGFDVVQLAALLYLTGGLLNPFSVMILAPVVVSAAVLRRQSTLVLIGLVAASVSFLLLFNIPLDWQADFCCSGRLSGWRVVGLGADKLFSWWLCLVGGVKCTAFVRCACRCQFGTCRRTANACPWDLGNGGGA